MPDALYNANEMREPVAREEEKETGRAKAFGDGVFAIAITLLILDVKVPHSAELGTRSLAAALLAQWSSYLSYTLSFLTVLMMSIAGLSW